MSVPVPAVEKKLTGLVAATFTPLTPNGEINLAEIGPYVDYLTTLQGVQNIFVNGTTGEGMSLSVQERKDVAQEWCLRAKGKIQGQVIVHVGCTSLRDSQELARHAEEIKVDAIAVISPSFFKPGTADALKKYLAEVHSVAPSLPFYYYHLPALTGVNIPARDVMHDIERLIPTFRGVKFSATDLLDLGRCVSLCKPNWTVLFGVDEQLLSALPLGADGAVGSLYNYLGSHYNKLLSAYEQKDIDTARTIQFKVQEFLCFAIQQGFNLGVNKELMSSLSGLTLGPPRLPVMPCPPAIANVLVQKFRSIFPDE